MATEQADKAEMEDKAHQHHEVEAEDDVLAIDLPAPEGWTKKFYPKRGGTPRKNEIIFISPTGEEIESKKQLSQYLKSHPGSPPSSEFDWGTGDTPRRSARLSSKTKATETPQSSSSQKRQKRSSSKKTAKDESADTDGEGKAHLGEVSTEAAEKTKHSIEVEMKDAEIDTKEEETKDAPIVTDDTKAFDQKTEERADVAAMVKPEHVDSEKLPEKEELPENNTGEAENKTDGKEADGEKLPNEKEELPDENKAEAQEKPAEAQAPQETNAAADPDSSVELKDANKAIPSESVPKVEKELQTENIEQKEVPKEVAKSGDIGLDTNGSKENNSVSHEETPHEPNPPPISC